MDMINPSNPNNKTNIGAKVLLAFCALAMISIFSLILAKVNINIPPVIPVLPTITPKPVVSVSIKEIKKFESENDFKEYIETSKNLYQGYWGSFSTQAITKEAMPAPRALPGDTSVNSDSSKAFANPLSASGGRVSQTNVQVVGIDEPDIVKTDGKEIYFSGTQRYYYSPMTRGIAPDNFVSSDSGISLEKQKKISTEKIMMPPAQLNETTNLIKAFPPSDLALDGKIDKRGEMLLENNILVILPTLNYYGNKQEITAYDVTNPKSPSKKWTLSLADNTVIVTSRLQNGKMYLITKKNINENRPCPINPFSLGNSSISISCQEIYHPIAPILADSTYTASLIDPASGKIGKTVSFVGSSYGFSGLTVVYVSKNAIYATYTFNESVIKFMNGFVSANKDIFPSTLVDKVYSLNNYDISETSKMSELTIILEKFTSSMSSDEKLKMENELENRMKKYYDLHRRDLEKTGIVKINLETFKISAQGEVPGHLLNNFSMDEHEGNLRVASTIGENWGILGSISSGQSVSDVTILDANLNKIGSIQDLGKTERIYSVRFIDDRGYVVTFRQVDPFYILDLANPRNPVMTGELKIPGYSSYLHPLDDTHILGIGQEGSQVKISLFDVTDKNNPVEIDKYLLDEYWTEVSNNYHAFLLDTKHNVFFLPGSKGGYVFLYKELRFPQCEDLGNCDKTETTNNYKLTLQKAVSQNSVKRAIYINDYLYIIGDDKITVLNENDWERVNELVLQ